MKTVKGNLNPGCKWGALVVTVHGTLKLENRNWKVGLHTFVLLMNTSNYNFQKKYYTSKQPHIRNKLLFSRISHSNI